MSSQTRPCIIFSTYFATMSTSRFTGSPGLSDFRLVIFTVCGIIAAVTFVPSIFATVRLMPSIAKRTFEDHVTRQFGRNFDPQPVVVRPANPVQREKLAGAVHVALNDVPAEASVGAHGQFQIHQRTFLDARERGALPGFLRQVGGERLWRDLDRSQADAADGDTVARLKLLVSCDAERSGGDCRSCCTMPATRPTSSMMPVNMDSPKGILSGLAGASGPIQHLAISNSANEILELESGAVPAEC